MRNIAKTKNVSVARIALSWLLHQSVVTSVIIGAKRPEQLEDNIAATKVALTGDELGRARQGERAAARVSRLDARASG